ncbi:hypothetical protein ACGFIR_09715 [Micromonospora sp. NPDC049051]|uniref:hypothetical protein n=1 Tax=Micromonospora sp. NPDC049051 TaxID=3364264 RepID=UPI00371B8663
MSRAELADAVNAALHRLYPNRDLAADYVGHRWVGKLERGEHRWPSRKRRAALRQALEVNTDAELDLYSPRRTPDTAPPGLLQDYLAADRTTRAPLNDELVHGDPDAWLRELGRLTAQPTCTWPQLRIRVREYLDVLDHLQRDRAQPHLARIDARLSEFMSWIADNTTSPDGAIWLDRSHRRATEADDQSLSAYALMRQSQRAIDNGDIRMAIALSRRSLAPGPVSARTRALCLTRMAEALAASGSDDDASTAIAAARRELKGAANNVSDQDDFAAHCDLRYVAAADARCRHLLGDSTSATLIFEELLKDLSNITRVDGGLWYTHLAECYLQHDPERAAHYGMAALQFADEGSYRVVRATQPLAIALRRHSAMPSARAFADRHRAEVTTQ